jgi:hypothetical protein
MTTENENIDAVLDVPEKEQGVEEDPIFDFLNGKPKDGEEDDDDMKDLDAEDGDTVEVLQAKLKAKNHIIRQREKAIKRMQKERDVPVKSGIGSDELAELIKAARGDKETQDNGAEEIAKLKEQFEQDPSTIIDLMLQRDSRLEQRLADVLTRRDNFFMGQLGKAKEEGIPKEIRDLAERLGTHPDYKGWTSEQLLTVAKTLKPFAKRIERAPAMTGSRPLSMTATGAEVEKVSKSVLEAMGYSE